MNLENTLYCIVIYYGSNITIFLSYQCTVNQLVRYYHHYKNCVDAGKLLIMRTAGDAGSSCSNEIKKDR